jgi:toxin-antitoxin system, antitoxin component, ribbon-helix-helix domain protein
MTNISIHLTESEYNLVRQHIENKGLTISQYIKVMLLEEIEDEYDVSIVNEYIQEKDTMAFLSFEDATKEWTLR